MTQNYRGLQGQPVATDKIIVVEVCLVINYESPILQNKVDSKFEKVFAKKSGHRDNGRGNSSSSGNIFDAPSGNNDKSKFR